MSSTKGELFRLLSGLDLGTQSVEFTSSIIEEVDDTDLPEVLENLNIPAASREQILDHVHEASSDQVRSKEPTGQELIPISPAEAKQRYLKQRGDELADSSMRTNNSSLRFFVRWCEQEGIENMNDLTGRDLQDYIHWRTHEAPTSVDELAEKSKKTQIDITRRFIEICGSFDAVPLGLKDKILPFEVPEEEEVREESLEMDRIEQIVDYLAQYEYASRDHVLWLLLAEFGPRVATLRSIDIDDFDHDAGSLKLSDEPDDGTSLKNDGKSERHVAMIREATLEVIEDYIDNQRIEVVDDCGREPLFSTRYGRIGKSTIRKAVYRWSCPAATDPELECENPDSLKCPGSVSPHPVRRGFITHMLREDVPDTVVSGRCDVSVRVMGKHYDARSEEEMMQTRKSQIMKSISG